MSSVFKPGHILDDHYELLDFKKAGGQAEIWSVRNIDYLDQLNLAVKFWPTPWEQRTETEYLQRLARIEGEKRLLGGINHSFIVRPHNPIGAPTEVDGKRYAVNGFVMDLASEGSLLDFYKSDTFATFNNVDKFTILEQLAQGLYALRSFEIIHNDIKPANLLVTNEAGHYRPRYADFGYAYRRGDIVVRGGTPGYMAPELDHLEPSFESDMFSLGVTFFEMLTGRHPIVDIDSEADRVKAVKGYFSTHEYIDSAPLRPLDCKPLTELIQQMCSREPDERPTIEELQEKLGRLTTEAKSHVTLRPDDIFPAIANRYRWAEPLHRIFREQEVIVFLDGTRPQTDPQFLVEALHGQNIQGFALFRVMGSSDYLLRLWVREDDMKAIESVLRDYQRERRGSYEMFKPTMRSPQPSKKVLDQLKDATQVVELLRAINDGDTKLLKSARNSMLICGETKAVRERGQGTKRNNAIRVVSRIRLNQTLNRPIAEVITEKVQALTDENPGLREVEVLADEGRNGANGEVVMFAELEKFHDYATIMPRVEAIITGLVAAHCIEKIRSHFEMDPLSNIESYDGRLIYELSQRRARRSRG